MLERATIRFNAARPVILKLVGKIQREIDKDRISIAHRGFVCGIQPELQEFSDIDPHEVELFCARAHKLRERIRRFLRDVPNEFVVQQLTIYQRNRFSVDCCAEFFNLTQLFTFISPRNDELGCGAFASVISREALEGRKVYYSSSGYISSDQDFGRLSVEQARIFAQEQLSLPEKYAISHFLSHCIKYSMRMPMILLRHEVIPNTLTKVWMLYAIANQRETCFADPYDKLFGIFIAVLVLSSSILCPE